MFKGKLVALTVATVLTSLTLVGCGTKEKVTEETSQKDQAKSLTLSFGAMPAVDSLPVYIAEKEGYFKEEGLDLDLQSFKSPKDRDAALSSGHLDGANTDLIALSAYRQGDLDMKIVSQSIGTFSVITGEESVEKLADLEGKKVGYIQKQAPEYFLAKALEKEKLSLSSIQPEMVPQIPVRVELTKNKKIAATIVPEPFTTIGEVEGLKELANSQELDIQTTIFGFKADVLNDKPEAVKAFYNAYNKGVDYINNHPLNDYYPVLVEKIGFTDAIKDKVKLPNYTQAKQIDPNQVKEAFDWSKEQGIYTKDWTDKDVMSDLLAK